MLIYRIEQKLIVSSNLHLVDYLMDVVRTVRDMRRSVVRRKVQGEDVDFAVEFKQAYMSRPYGPAETEAMLEQGFPKDDAGVTQFPARFIERRLKVREYLKGLYVAVSDE